MSKTYRAEVTREDGWWMIRVPDLDLTTQAERWAEVETMARGVIAADLDLEPAAVTVEVVPVPDPAAARLFDMAKCKALEADRLRAEALAANQEAARCLYAEGWSFRLIGKAMGLTHQRAEQLVKGTR